MGLVIYNSYCAKQIYVRSYQESNILYIPGLLFYRHCVLFIYYFLMKGSLIICDKEYNLFQHNTPFYTITLNSFINKQYN